MVSKRPTKRLTAAVYREGKLYVSQCLEVDVASQGKTVETALSNLVEALELYFEDGGSVAVSEAPIIAPVDVRMPRAG